MGILKVIKPGAFTSIQDGGRKGFNFYAVPNSGVMDAISANQGNRLLGNETRTPVIECTSVSPTIEFLSNTQICITGAHANWELNGNEIELNKVITIVKHDILSGKKMADGFRSYICIKGELKTQQHFGSGSLYLNAKLGGHNGHVFKKNDLIEWEEKTIDSVFETNQSEVDLSTLKSMNPEIEIYKGPEFDRLNQEDIKAIESFEFRLSNETSRMGAKLDCQKRIVCYPSQLENSVPVFPGVIQSTPSGKLIVVLQDGQTTGGYPRIAYIGRYQLNYFNQIPLNKTFRFRWNS